MKTQTKRRMATAKSVREVAALLPPQATLTKGGVIEGLPYLRPREIATMKFIFEYLGRHRHYPTRAEIAQAVLVSQLPGTASVYLKRLFKFGYLTRAELSHRNLRLTAAGLERLGQEGIAVHHQQLPLATP
jgi:hypothetical protein